jgi:ribosomal protein S18 acetylase RimI-like enzyme
MRGKGLGTALLEESERRIASMGGTRVYIETSARSLYEPTRAFYLARGYREEARLADYYAPGDAKVIYVKIL